MCIAVLKGIASTMLGFLVLIALYSISILCKLRWLLSPIDFCLYHESTFIMWMFRIVPERDMILAVLVLIVSWCSFAWFFGHVTKKIIFKVVSLSVPIQALSAPAKTQGETEETKQKND